MEPKTSPAAASVTPGVVRSLNSKTKNGDFFVKNSIIIFIVFILLGVGTGFAVAKFKSSTTSSGGPSAGSEKIKKGAVVGSTDTTTFKDTAEGVMREGGIGDEGTHHLERPGGDSQNVYLTSSVVDLSSFVGKKVKVWGKTFDGDKAGWLMDVGRVEVLK
jgi:hypothetical protein